jgi:ABC-type glutathione transport system ATPase component
MRVADRVIWMRSGTIVADSAATATPHILNQEMSKTA